jgi:hypothetical protein
VNYVAGGPPGDRRWRVPGPGTADPFGEQPGYLPVPLGRAVRQRPSARRSEAPSMRLAPNDPGVQPAEDTPSPAVSQHVQGEHMLPDPSRGQQDALGLLLGPGTFGSGPTQDFGGGRQRYVAGPLPSRLRELLLLPLLALLALLAFLGHANHPASRPGQVNDVLTETSTYH